MKNVFFLSLIIILSLSFSNCSEADENPKLQCDQELILDKDRYDNSEASFFFINSVNINDDCLELAIGYSGCNEHDVDLVWNGSSAKSLPPQVDIKLMDIPQACLAFFETTISFDLQSLGEKPMIIHLNGWEDRIRYE